MLGFSAIDMGAGAPGTLMDNESFMQWELWLGLDWEMRGEKIAFYADYDCGGMVWQRLQALSDTVNC